MNRHSGLYASECVRTLSQLTGVSVYETLTGLADLEAHGYIEDAGPATCGCCRRYELTMPYSVAGSP